MLKKTGESFAVVTVVTTWLTMKDGLFRFDEHIYEHNKEFMEIIAWLSLLLAPPALSCEITKIQPSCINTLYIINVIGMSS